MFSEDELLPISALQHLEFCPRQWALMYLENVWDENELTAQGRILHESTDQPSHKWQGDVLVARSVRLRSLRLGLTGIADVVEFHPATGTIDQGTTLPGLDGLWSPYPVEYKRGRPKLGLCDEVQLCAQALCLEEMLSVTISSGAFFYGQPRRRYEVTFDSSLCRKTETLSSRLHQLTSTGETPPACYTRRCRSCSIYDWCRPKSVGRRKSARRYLERIYHSGEFNMEPES